MKSKGNWPAIHERKRRVHEIAELFPPGSFFNARQVADHFKVTERSAYRYLSDMEKIYPIISDTAGHYHIKTRPPK